MRPYSHVCNNIIDFTGCALLEENDMPIITVSQHTRSTSLSVLNLLSHLPTPQRQGLPTPDFLEWRGVLWSWEGDVSLLLV